jgi:hypothetical protein
MKSYRFRMLLFALLCLAGFSGNAQNQTWNWVSHNNLARRYYIDVVADQNGYVYAGGNDSLGFVLTKYKPNGIKIWSKSDPGTEVVKLSIDAAGNLYITAESHNFSGSLINTARLDSAGNRLWTKGLFAMSSPTDGPTAALFTGAADADGNTYMSGKFKPIAQFDTISLSNLAPENYFLAKYNSAGKIQWLRLFNDPVYAIAGGPQGSYFIECGTHFQKYAANGTLIWQQNFSGTFTASGQFSGNKFKSDAQGNLYVLGNKMAKYNSNGTLAWAKTNSGTDFSLTNAGNILLTGYFIGNITFGNGVPDLTSATANKTLFAAQFSGVDGSANWAKQASTSGPITGEAIFSLPNGNCAVAGNFLAGSTFDQLSLTGKGFFVAKLSGNMLGFSKNVACPNFRLFPNPATSEATIFNPEFQEGTIAVFNATGQKIHEAAILRKSNVSLNTENWPAGIYLVKLISAETTATQKLIVTH